MVRFGSTSASTSRTRALMSASRPPKFASRVVLPTPTLVLIAARTCGYARPRGRASAAIVCGWSAEENCCARGMKSMMCQLQKCVSNPVGGACSETSTSPQTSTSGASQTRRPLVLACNDMDSASEHAHVGAHRRSRINFRPGARGSDCPQPKKHQKQPQRDKCRLRPNLHRDDLSLPMLLTPRAFRALQRLAVQSPGRFPMRLTYIATRRSPATIGKQHHTKIV